MEDLREMTVAGLTELTWSDAPAPGGGSIAALTGSLAAALTGMVANLSQSAKFDAVRDKMADIAQETNALRVQLLAAMQADTEAFSAYMAALKLPKDTDEEKAVRRAAMQNGLKQAAETPLRVAESIAPIFALIEQVILHGNPNAVTDALVAAMLARCAMLGALFNTKINLDGIRDEAYVQAMRAQVLALERAALAGEKQALAMNAISCALGD